VWFRSRAKSAVLAHIVPLLDRVELPRRARVVTNSGDILPVTPVVGRLRIRTSPSSTVSLPRRKRENANLVVDQVTLEELGAESPVDLAVLGQERGDVLSTSVRHEAVAIAQNHQNPGLNLAAQYPVPWTHPDSRSSAMLASTNGTPVLPCIHLTAACSSSEVCLSGSSWSQSFHHPGRVFSRACFGSVISSNPPSVNNLGPNLLLREHRDPGKMRNQPRRCSPSPLG
jgi:hypothetical protein